jgi:pyruvate formate lyase activating enzyme
MKGVDYKTLYWHADGDRVVCDLCPHGCRLKDGQSGICRSRVNVGGELVATAYGRLCSIANDPIEKKPLQRFYPGTRCLSVASTGCNLRCLNCQNWEISQMHPDEVESYFVSPKMLVDKCVEMHLPTIAFTYSEPLTWYEYVYDTAKLAHERGLLTVLVSAGYVNEEPLRQLVPYIDAANIDLKSFSDDVYHRLNGASLAPVLRSLKIFHEAGVELEITNLVIPGWNDDLEMIRQMCQWLVGNNMEEHPLHFTRFFPMYRLNDAKPTPVDFLRKAKAVAVAEGMKYVYLGNV